MKKLFLTTMLSLLFPQASNAAPDKNDQDLIIIAAPSIADTYDDELYAEVFDDIIDFDITYANAVYGKDQVRILVDKETRQYFEGEVPEEILVESGPMHIWMRDFTTVNPYQPMQFRYTAASMEGNQREADDIQYDFNAFLKKVGIRFPQANYNGKYLLLDGGNIVDNYDGRVVTTDRFLEDNGLTKSEGIAALKKLIGATEVAVVPADDPVLAHSDGMVMFSDRDTLFVNYYDEPLRSQVLSELKRAFPGIKIVEVDVAWDEEDDSSACGINLNATVTTNYIYMPHFGDETSDEAMETIQEHTDKTVIPVPANKVCKLGGSVRCLSWQQSGKYSKKLLSRI